MRICYSLIGKLSPSEAHFEVVRHVLTYLKDNLHFGICFENIREINLHGYCDSDWVRCVDNSKSIYGYVFRDFLKIPLSEGMWLNLH